MIAHADYCNTLPDELKRDPACDVDSFKQFLEQLCSVFISTTSALKVLTL